MIRVYDEKVYVYTHIYIYVVFMISVKNSVRKFELAV